MYNKLQCSASNNSPVTSGRGSLWIKGFTVLGIVMQCRSVQYKNKMLCLEHNALASSGCISQNRGELGVQYRGYSVQSSGCSVQSIGCSMQCRGCSVQSIGCSMQYRGCSVQYRGYSVQYRG